MHFEEGPTYGSVRYLDACSGESNSPLRPPFGRREKAEEECERQNRIAVASDLTPFVPRKENASSLSELPSCAVTFSLTHTDQAIRERLPSSDYRTYALSATDADVPYILHSSTCAGREVGGERKRARELNLTIGARRARSFSSFLHSGRGIVAVAYVAGFLRTKKAPMEQPRYPDCNPLPSNLITSGVTPQDSFH